jgi:hypothetical protein
MIAAPGPVYPWPIGAGPRYHPPALHAAVAAGRPVGRLTCSRTGRQFAVHVELFAARKVVVVPAGIGKGPHGCSYPLHTDVPTGVVEVSRNGQYVLGDLFRVWGRRLDRHTLLSFSGRVTVFVGGRRCTGDPRRLPLTRHAQIVVEVGPYVAPHRTYLFPKGVG